MKFGWVWFLLLGSVQQAAGSVDLTPHPLGYSTALYTTVSQREGLSHSSVTTIIQDRKGFLWVGTQAGLNRYDGHSVRVYNKRTFTKNTFSNDAISTLLLGSGQDLWIGTLGGGVQRFDIETESVTQVQIPASIEQGAFHLVNDLKFDNQHRLWIASDSGIAYLEDGSMDAVIVPGFPSGKQARGIEIGIDGTIWVVSDSGLYRYHPDFSGFKKIDLDGPGDLDLNPKFIKRDKNGLLWVINKTGHLFSVSVTQDHWRVIWHAATDVSYPQSIEVDHLNNLWIGGIEKTQIYLTDEDRFIDPFLETATDRHFNARSFYSGDDGVFWIGTNLEGLKYTDLSDRSIATLPLPGGKSAVTILHGEDQMFYIGAHPGFYSFDADSRKFQHFSVDAAAGEDDSDSTVLSLYRDETGIWFASIHGVGVVNLETNSLSYRLRQQFVYPHIIGRKKNGDLLVGDDTALLTLRPDGRKVLRKTAMNRTLSSLAINENEILVGGFFGLQRYGRDCDCFEDVLPIETEQGNEKPIVTSIMRARDGSLWLGTHNLGILKLDLPQNNPVRADDYKIWGITSGLAANAVGGILEDAKGALWISTTAGLSQFDPTTQVFTNFTSKQGASAKGYFVNSLAQDTSGSMLFGAPGSVTWLSEFELQLPPSRPPVITDIRLANVPLTTGDILKKMAPYTDTLVLPYGSPALSFDFASLNFGHTTGVNFRYRLDPIDKQWTTTTKSRRVATYTSLHPGKHSFRVAAADIDGVFRGAETSIDIEIVAPWWFRRNALVIFALMGSVILSLLHWLWLRSITRQKTRLEETVLQRTQQLQAANAELQEALDHVKTLKGIVPICSNCKKIRDDKGYWQQVEVYIAENTEAEFTHGICTDCMGELYDGDLSK